MKTTRILSLAVAAVLAVCVSCSSNDGYDSKTANALSEKVNNGDELSQDDYATMIKQCEAAAEIINARFDNLLELTKKGDAKKLAEAFESCTDDEIMDASENFQTLGEHLNHAPLDEENARRWQEFQPKAQELVTKMFAVFQ